MSIAELQRFGTTSRLETSVSQVTNCIDCLLLCKHSAVTGSSFQLTRRTTGELQFTSGTTCEVEALLVLVQIPRHSGSPVMFILNHCPEQAHVQWSDYKIQVKFAPAHAIKAYRGRRGIAPLILDLRWR